MRLVFDSPAHSPCEPVTDQAAPPFPLQPNPLAEATERPTNCLVYQRPHPLIAGLPCSSVIEYFEAPAMLLNEFHRVLKSHGKLIVSLPNRQALVRIFENSAFRLTGWPPYLALVRHQYGYREACSLLNAEGFKVNRVEAGGLGIGAWFDRLRCWGPLLFISAEKR